MADDIRFVRTKTVIAGVLIAAVTATADAQPAAPLNGAAASAPVAGVSAAQLKAAQAIAAQATQGTPAAPVPSTTTSTTTGAQDDAAANQFQQWLQANNSAQNQAGQTMTTVTTTTVTADSNQLPPKPNGRRPMTFEENQQAMLDSAPPSNLPRDPDAGYAFNNMLQQNMPLTPQQTVKLRQQIDVSQRAAAIPANIPPKPVSSTIMLNLAPGTTPPAIRLAQGYVSSLVFVDSTGQPWPIAAFDIGNPKAVNIQWDGKSNILLIQAVLPYSDGDIVVRLVGLPTPITLELVAGQRVVDYRVDLHVSGIGPNSKDMPIGSELPNNANSLLLGVLDGIAPPGSRMLSVFGADAQAWLLGQRMFLRTRLTVLSPGWIGTMVSPDGMHAYELPRTSTVLVSRYGTPAELRIEGF